MMRASKTAGLLLGLLLTASLWGGPIGGKHIYYGASYYPENWDMAEVEGDIARMKALKMNVVRMGEFAWSKMEPSEGQYDFEWLRTIIRKLHAAGIDVILGTPTAAPPAWLGARYPQIYRVTEEGFRLGHGARRNCSYTSRVYQAYCRRICEEMARALGNEPGVIAWQTDNEFSISPDYGEETRQAWIAWLKEHYGSVGRINELWGLNQWSQQYSDWDQIPMPGERIWHHISLRFAWSRFNSEMVCRFQEQQIEAIRRFSPLPITHDSMPGQTLDYSQLFRPLDFAAMNAYHSFEAYDLIQSNYDRMRGLGKGCFWLFETAPNNSGGGDHGSTWFLHQIPGSMLAALWMSFASGAQGAMFWPWRQGWSGQETTHGAVISAWGEPAANWDEIRRLGEQLELSSPVLMDNPPAPAEAAIMYSHDSANGLAIEKFANGLKYYQDWSYRFYRPMADNYLFRDVIYPEATIEGYKLLFLPLLPLIPDSLGRRLETWVRAGGILIAGPMSAYRSAEWTQFRDRQMGPFELWTGIKATSCLPIGTSRREKERPVWVQLCEDLGGGTSEASLWSLAFEDGVMSVRARYTSGHQQGKAAIVENRVGKGKVVLLGTDPGQDAVGKILLHYAREAGIAPDAEGDPGIVVVPRKGTREGYALVNITPDPKRIRLPNVHVPLHDLLGSSQYAPGEEIRMEPYETKLLFP